MITNRYAGKCKSCSLHLDAGAGFAFKSGVKWFAVCNSSACHRTLGLSTELPGKTAKKLSIDGLVTMAYDSSAIPLLRAMPGAKWQPEIKAWKVSIETKDLKRVLEIADQLGLEVPDELRQKVILGTVDSNAAILRAKNVNVNGKNLFQFQKEGVEFLALHDRALLGDDMGLGKTVQALMAIGENESVIVICPSAVKYNWRSEANLWRPEYKVTICEGRKGFKIPEAGEIVIINYDILPSFLTVKKGEEIQLTTDQKEIFSKIVLIADEAHLTKNYKTARSQKVTQLSKLAKNVWFLTGTPLMNRPTDLYGILCAGNMNALGTWNNFLKLFNGRQNKFGGFTFGMPSTAVPEIMKRVMLRRLKTEVLKDLPPKTYQMIEVNDIDKSLVDEMDSFINNYSCNMDGSEDIANLDLPDFRLFSAIRAKLANSRIPVMNEIVESYEETNTPLVVFSAHKNPIHSLSGRDGWKTITGETQPEERHAIVEMFQSGQLKGIGLTIQAGGVGLTLTHSSNALFVDLDWTPAMNIQAEDRICRIGQTSNKVLIQRMVSSHPLDLHMQKLIEYKMELAFRALEGKIDYKANSASFQNLKEESDDELQDRLSKIHDATKEVDRKIAQEKINNIYDRECAKVSNIAQPNLTIERKEMLKEALNFMVSVCDGAQEKDGIGFSKPDASIGHWIAETGLEESDDITFRVLERILVRYRRQLGKMFCEIWE